MSQPIQSKGPWDFPTDLHNYDVLWSLKHDKGRVFASDKGAGYALPIFLAEDDWQTWKDSGEARGSLVAIAIGILYSWNEPTKWLYSGPGGLDELRLSLLDEVRRTMDYSTFEEFALGAASWVRWHCGFVPSRTVIVGALHVERGNPLLQYECILDSWWHIERLQDVPLVEFCENLLQFCAELDLNALAGSPNIGQPNINTVCYVVLSCMLLLGRKQDFEANIEHFSRNLMQAPGMVEQLRNVASKTSATIDDLRMFHSDAADPS